MTPHKFRHIAQNWILISNSNWTFSEFYLLIYVGVLGPKAHIYVYIGSRAQSKDVKSSEEGWTLSEESVLVSEEVSFGYKGPWGWSEDEYIIG